eukprot:m.346129 g.346129  ORF g.346129 m.346129 type:complete len:552 (-) comp28201_c0_seq1:49-1704(-)
MTGRNIAFVAFLLFFRCSELAHGEMFRLSNVMGSSMVLQRAPQDAHVQGFNATPGGVVRAVLSDSSGILAANNSTGDLEGTFIIVLPQLQAGGPYTLTVTDIKTNAIVNLTDVLVGDVYFCSGQSNMEFTVSAAFNATRECADASNWPNVRLFTSGAATSSFPLQELADISQNWSKSSPEEVCAPGRGFKYSAVCYFFGREIHKRTGVPVGLISSWWGGTIIEAWSPPQALEKCPMHNNSLFTPKRNAFPDSPSELFNAMVAPFLNSTAITGVLWYQGENNACTPETEEDGLLYGCQLNAFITSWRSMWRASLQHGKEFFFGVVQLAPWNNTNTAGSEICWSTSIANIRLQQAEVADNLTNIALSSAVDLGDIASPYGSVHIRNKQQVAQRLVLGARALVYNESVVYKSPSFNTASTVYECSGDGGRMNYYISVQFNVFGDNVAISLPPGAYSSTMFEVQDDRLLEWEPATIIFGDVGTNNMNVSVSFSGNQGRPCGVRYMYKDFPVAAVFANDYGNNLPLLPFSFSKPENWKEEGNVDVQACDAGIPSTL